MNVECPSCKMIGLIAGDQILTSQHDIEVACPNCNFELVLELQVGPEKTGGVRSPIKVPKNQPEDSDPHT